MAANNRAFEDMPISIKTKLSACWIAVMFCYVYGDFFLLFVPGRIKNLMEGNSGAGTTTPLSLLAFAIMMTVPIVMIVLSLVLKPRINRMVNIAAGILFTLIMGLVVATSFGEWMIFYTYLGILEMILTILIIWQAWKWPKL